jgi:hypothetical protein
MAVDADDGAGATGQVRPRGSGSTGAAAQIHDRVRRRRRGAECRHHVGGGNEVERRVIERERRALAGAVETAGHCMTPLDVCGRQGAKRPRHLSRAKIGEVSRFRDRVPGGQPIRYCFYSHRLDVRPQHGAEASRQNARRIYNFDTEDY